ncbi:MAG: rhomboid family intramembrane serine protease [Alphaproteobacteria bacterium]|nr:rhomboid family intramembrane serine protease [Alphaproteobacteria bacterium]
MKQHRSTPERRASGGDLSLAERARPIIVIVGAIWVVFLLDLILPLEQLGLVPRSFTGLIGIVTMPFLHGNLTHLLSNTLPLVILLGLMVLSRPRPWSTMVLLTLISGAALWLLGRPALHIGASGLIYALMGFLIAAGVLERRLLPAAVALFVGLTYGASIIGGILPGQRGVSWEGHLFGLLAGAALAWTRFGPARRA